MKTLVGRIDRTFYPGVEDNWDDRLFRERILSRLRPSDVVLDLGAGAGIVAAMNFRGKAARVCGVDLDPRVVDNPYLDEGRVGDGATLPYSDGTFDLVFADNVAEHLDAPVEVFREVARVLKPGGSFMFKTPNVTHYMPLVARLTPHSFHGWINRRRGRREVDTFPTRYRVNSAPAVARVAKAAGLTVRSIDRIEGRPEYLRISAASYLIGVAYERLVNASPALARFRLLMVAELAKPDKAAVRPG